MTIVEFLEARIAEDEASADHIHADDCRPRLGFPCDCGYPARVLAECAAKRAVISEIEGMELQIDGEWGVGKWTMDMSTPLRAFAAVYADHPDYRAEWAV
ncbi:MAG: hypothetical protein JWM93_2478 [Frankiales bacterium]|nr:hypothetical protein [Frankiales bacterium]